MNPSRAAIVCLILIVFVVLLAIDCGVLLGQQSLLLLEFFIH